MISDTAGVRPGLQPAEKMETTHFSIVDKWGNAVSNTYTLNGFFGSGEVVRGAGVLLNDEMDDFSVDPGRPNWLGLIGGEANAIAPDKRPLSTMTPTILTRHGRVSLVLGTPGGPTIVTSVFQVITDLYAFNMPLSQAVAAPRFHHQLLPENTIFWEPYKPIDSGAERDLLRLGYKLKPLPFSEIEAIQIDGNLPDPVADPRGSGVAEVIK
jgi:gamma-glutamyltranspeptidase/glutathione hydrolase